MLLLMFDEAYISSGDVVDGQLAFAVEHRRASVVGEVADETHPHPRGFARQNLVRLKNANDVTVKSVFFQEEKVTVSSRQ